MECNKPVSKVFISSGEIVISKPVATVFSYLADMRNDQFWRDEVKHTTAESGPGLHCQVQQQTELNKNKPLYSASYICNKFIANEEAMYETTTDSTDWQRSIRHVQAIDASTTKVLYTVEFERNIIKHGMSVVPPSFMIDLFLTATIKKYLQQLKDKLEQ